MGKEAAMTPPPTTRTAAELIKQWRDEADRCPLVDVAGLVRHHADVLEAALRAAHAPERLTWQPMETAPKDGTRVLTYGQDGVMTSWYQKSIPNWPYYGWQGVTDPTHWMPIPAAPDAAPSPRPEPPVSPPEERERIAEFLEAVFDASTHGASSLFERAIAAVRRGDMSDPVRIADPHTPTPVSAAPAPSEEPVHGSEVLCEDCAVVFCPHGERLHFHHDGCPMCDANDPTAGSPLSPVSEEADRIAEQEMRAEAYQHPLGSIFPAIAGLAESSSSPAAPPRSAPLLSFESQVNAFMASCHRDGLTFDEAIEVRDRAAVTSWLDGKLALVQSDIRIKFGDMARAALVRDWLMAERSALAPPEGTR